MFNRTSNASPKRIYLGPSRVLIGLLIANSVIANNVVASNVVSLPDGKEVKTELAPVSEAPGPLELKALSYIRFREDISQVETLSFDSAQATRDAHVRLGTHDSGELSSGWMAYAALIAADTPEFMEAMQAELLKKEEVPSKKKKRRSRKKKKPKPPTQEDYDNGRRAFLDKLSKNPSYPRTLPGAQAAIDAVMAVSRADYNRITSLGESFKSQAYEMQKTRWGKRRIASSQQRLSEVESYAYNRPGVSMPIFAKVSNAGITKPGIATTQSASWTPQWGYKSVGGLQTKEDSQVIMDRVLNLAARYAVGSINEKIVLAYAKNNKSQQCLSLVKLTLNQCIAATRTPYEEAFCLGEHALSDVANCVSGR